MYLRVRDTLALAADYDPRDADAQRFFQAAQNKRPHLAYLLHSPCWPTVKLHPECII